MSKWYSFKELKRARTPMLLDSVTGLPDNHVITVVERVISVDDPELIQNNVRTDTFTLNLDAEYDDLNVVVIFTKPNNINVKVAYNGTPTHIPGSAMELVGSLACSVVGIDADGEVRAVTKAAPDTFQVVKSGAYDGSVTSDDAELLGQILQAVSDAEAAITEAETATTAATNATNQAASAATSANQAASSANSAASSANSAATRATSAAVNAENAYDTLQPYMATIDSCANVLHREVGPDSVVTADDSFPCKPVEMVVYGNTVQNLWVNPSGTKNGVTVTSNADGSTTIRGTVTGQGVSGQRVIHSLKPSTQYTLSIDKTIPNSSASGFVVAEVWDGSWRVQHKVGMGSTNVVTFTTSEHLERTDIGFGATGDTGKEFSGTYRVMLNEGSTAEPWCPPGLNSVGDDGSVEVVTAGKNLFTSYQDAFQIQGENIANQIKVIGKKNKNIPIGSKVIFSFDYRLSSGGGTATIQQTALPYLSLGVYQRVLSGDNTWHKAIGSVVTSSIDFIMKDACSLRLDNVTGLLDIKNIQLELGSTATDYEPPNITTIPIDLQGHTLNALPDGTRDELHIDGGGNVVLEKRCGVAVAPTGEESWTFEAEYGRGLFGISPRTINTAGIGTLLCDKLPPRQVRAEATVGTYSLAATISAYARVATIDSLSELVPIAGGATYIYKLAEPQTIDLGTITPPTMAAPNVTVYVADDTPAEMELDYVRDINIVVDRLEKKVADLVVTEATIV